jgi:hypothetical protein
MSVVARTCSPAGKIVLMVVTSSAICGRIMVVVPTRITPMIVCFGVAYLADPGPFQIAIHVIVGQGILSGVRQINYVPAATVRSLYRALYLIKVGGSHHLVAIRKVTTNVVVCPMEGARV